MGPGYTVSASCSSTAALLRSQCDSLDTHNRISAEDFSCAYPLWTYCDSVVKTTHAVYVYCNECSSSNPLYQSSPLLLVVRTT